MAAMGVTAVAAQVGELVGQQILGKPGIVVDELAQPSRLVPG